MGPRPGAVGRPITTVGLSLLFGFVYVFLVAISVFVAPRFEMILQDFKADVPGITVLFLAMCRGIRNYYGWLLLLPLAIGMPIVITQLTWRPGSTRQRGMRLLGTIGITFILFAIFVVFVVLALFLPMVALIDAASAPRR
jgi:type II secretory pathway component PulF